MTATEKEKQGRGRVLIIAPQPFYEERGTPMNVRLMCTILGRAGYVVDLLVFPTGKDVEMPGVNIIRIPNVLGLKHIPIGFSWKKLFFDSLLPFWCLCLCVKNRYQIIHGVEEGGLLAVFFGRFVGRCGTIFDMDSVMSDQFGPKGGKKKIQGIVRLMERWAMQRASVVLTVCKALSDAAYKTVPAASVVQIEDIPLEFAFPLPDAVRDQSRLTVEQKAKDLDLEHKRILLYTGNLQSYQGIELMLDSWQKFVQSIPDSSSYRLVIVGGPQQLVQSYKKRLPLQEGQSSVCFVGPRPAAEMGTWMQLADALISPRSEGENTPLKIYTYMAAGKPIIATRMLTHTQVLTDETALLVAPEVEEMAKAIQEILAGDDKENNKGTAAFALVKEQYSYAVFEQKLLHAYTLAQKRT